MEYCPEHHEIRDLLHKIDKTTGELSIRINGSVDNISKHIEHGQAWRIAIASVAIGVIIESLILASMWGQLVNIVETNTGRLVIIEETIYRNAEARE